MTEDDTCNSEQDNYRPEVTFKGFDVDKMGIDGLRDIVKMLLRLTNFEHDRLTALQNRVFELECRSLNR